MRPESNMCLSLTKYNTK